MTNPTIDSWTGTVETLMKNKHSLYTQSTTQIKIEVLTKQKQVAISQNLGHRNDDMMRPHVIRLTPMGR